MTSTVEKKWGGRWVHRRARAPPCPMDAACASSPSDGTSSHRLLASFWQPREPSLPLRPQARADHPPPATSHPWQLDSMAGVNHDFISAKPIEGII